MSPERESELKKKSRLQTHLKDIKKQEEKNFTIVKSDNLHEHIIQIFDEHKKTNKDKFKLTIDKTDKIENNRLALFFKILKDMQREYNFEIKINFQ